MRVILGVAVASAGLIACVSSTDAAKRAEIVAAFEATCPVGDGPPQITCMDTTIACMGDHERISPAARRNGIEELYLVELRGVARDSSSGVHRNHGGLNYAIKDGTGWRFSADTPGRACYP